MKVERIGPYTFKIWRRKFPWLKSEFAIVYRSPNKYYTGAFFDENFTFKTPVYILYKIVDFEEKEERTKEKKEKKRIENERKTLEETFWKNNKLPKAFLLKKD